MIPTLFVGTLVLVALLSDWCSSLGERIKVLESKVEQLAAERLEKK